MSLFADALITRARELRNCHETPLASRIGCICSFDGSVAVASGIDGPIDTICRIAHGPGHWREAAIVGFRDGRALLMALEPDFAPTAGAAVVRNGQLTGCGAGEAYLGRIVDGYGRAVDGGPAVRAGASNIQEDGEQIRGRVTQAFDCGVRAINGLFTLGRGQRIGLIGGSGVGKSMLLDMLLRSSEADIIVAALIGERSREITDFVHNIHEHGSFPRTAIVAVPASAPALARIQGAWRATAMAAHFRGRGKSVLLVLDSLTRVAHAAREVGIAVGEPALARSYPPSALNLVTRLIERAGPGSSGGAITAIYTILADGDDLNDPVVDTARAILDGHIALSQTLAGRGHYPAIDLANSVSRTMPRIASATHIEAARRLRRDHSLIESSRDLVSMGAYAPGHDLALDAALRRSHVITAFLSQGTEPAEPLAATIARLEALMRDG